MRNRLPSLVSALIDGVVGFFSAFAVQATVASVFWLFVYGDGPWPDSANFVVDETAFLILAAIFTFTGMIVGYIARSTRKAQ